MTTTEDQQQFEKNKNIKAAGYTIGVIASLFLVFFLFSWTLPKQLPEPVNEGVEVNLGSSDMGMGTVAPLSPGEPSEAKQTTSEPPPTTHQTAETQPEVIPNKDENATPVNTSPKPEKKTPKTVNNTVTKAKKPKEIVATKPVPQKPKAIFQGGKSTSNSGNNPDAFNKSSNQGIAGGKGDQGKPNGNPNSDSYKGNGGTGTSGINITGGLDGRRVSGSYHFEDTYSHGGTVSVNVTVDPNGKVTGASLKLPSGNAEIDKIALRRAMQVTFSKGTEVQTGTIKIKFEDPKG